MTPSKNTALSPILAGLRTAGDEVQFERVLVNLLGGNPVAATRFVDAVLRAARAKSRVKPRGRVSCTNQVDVGARGVAIQRQQAAQRGRVDLDFTDDADFRLSCELKIDDELKREKVVRYLGPASAAGGFLVAIVRAPQLKDKKAIAHPRWLGEVRWADILGDLKKLPVGSQQNRQQWLALLRVMDDHGDFAEQPPGASTSDLSFVNEVAGQVLGHLQKRLGAHSDPRAGVLAERFEALEERSIARGWARASIALNEVAYFSIDARGAAGGGGTFRIVWHGWPDSRPKHLLRAQAKLQAHGFTKTGWTYRLDRPIGRRERGVKAAAAQGSRAVDAVLELDLLRPDIEESKVTEE